MHRFLCGSELVPGRLIFLEADQSHHVAKVLRLAPGEIIGLIDGKGVLATASLVEVKPKHTTAQVVDRVVGEPPSVIRLCFGLPKGQALDFIFHRATELGVGALQPLLTRFSAAKKGWNPSRWDHVVQETCKQCQELFFPTVEEPVDLGAWLQRRDKGRLLVLCDENARAGEVLPASPKGVDLVVGAEGGFHPEEIALLRNEGAVLLGLGKNRLRAETSALVALTLAKKHIAEL